MTLSFPPHLQTERLLLRPPAEADAECMFERYSQDPQVCRYMSWGPHRSIDDTLAYVRRIVGDNSEGTSAGYLIFARGSGELLGSIGGRYQDEVRLQFGYCLARDAWGKGYATEAARAFVAAALEQASIWRIQAFCDVDNSASARVLQKAGLEREAMLRRYITFPNLGSEPRDVWLYAKVRGMA